MQMSKYLHKELRPRQPRPVSRGSHCLFHEVHLSKKAKGKNFANDDCKFIGHIWNFFMTQLLLRSRSFLTIAVISFMIIGFPINHGQNFFQLFGWESFMWFTEKSTQALEGILQKLFSIKTFFVASWGNFAELNNLQILFCDFLGIISRI